MQQWVRGTRDSGCRALTGGVWLKLSKVVSLGCGLGRAWRVREGSEKGASVLCHSWVFLIGSAHMLDSELPKQTCLCVLPKITPLGVFVVPSGSLHLVSLPRCCCFMESLLAFVVFPLGLLRFGLLNTEEIVSVPGAFLCPGVTLLFKLPSNLSCCLWPPNGAQDRSQFCLSYRSSLSLLLRL